MAASYSPWASRRPPPAGKDRAASIADAGPQGSFGMPTYAQWLSQNENFSRVERKLRAQKSVMTGRIRSLDEVRQHLVDKWQSPLAKLQTVTSGLFWIEWGLFLFTVLRNALNVMVIANNFAHRPCAFGDHFYCQPPKVGDNWVYFEYIVAATEGAGLLMLLLLFGISVLTFVFDCAYDFGAGRPRALYHCVIAFQAITSFSMLSAVRLFQPEGVGAALRRIWALGVPPPAKILLVGLLLLLIPISVLVVFAKLSQLEQSLVLPLEDWHFFPEFVTFLGFLNQLLGITENNQSETSVVLDFIFLGQDAVLSEAEQMKREFIVQTMYLDAVGKWGWKGFVFMFNLGGTGWQKLFIIEDQQNPSQNLRENNHLIADTKRLRYGALQRLQSRSRAGSSRATHATSISLDRIGKSARGSAEGLWSRGEYGRMVSYVRTGQGSSRRQSPVQVQIHNDYSRHMRGYIEPLQDPQIGASPQNPETLSWFTAPGQSYFISEDVQPGQPYRVVINLGDIGGDGQDAHVILPFTTPIRGDVKLSLNAILHYEAIRFGAIDKRETTMCDFWSSCRTSTTSGGSNGRVSVQQMPGDNADRGDSENNRVPSDHRVYNGADFDDRKHHTNSGEEQSRRRFEAQALKLIVHPPEK